MKWLSFIGVSLLTLLIVFGTFFLMNDKPRPERVTYGISFNTFYAVDLGLDWRETYDAILDDLGVKHLRLAAHWPMIEPERGVYSFTEIDYQLDQAEVAGADVILAIGRRLPRWPECHVPEWAKPMAWEEQKDELREYIEAVVNRYRDRSNIIMWQVENEPFLSVFAHEHCGDLDREFLEEEITLVKSLDPTRPVLVTDSGNLGTWAGAYRLGDAFGTSVYVYFWNPEFGQFRTVLPPWFYRFKEAVMRLLFQDQPTYLIELSAEPWLVQPIPEVDVDTQYSRMDLDKIREIIDYAKDTRYDRQYLWGAEWWYWLKLRGHEEIWGFGKELFAE